MIAIAKMCVMIIISFEVRKFVAFYEMAAHIIIAICSSCLLKSLHRNSHKRNTNYAFKMLRLMGTSQQSNIVDTQISMGNEILFSQMHKCENTFAHSAYHHNSIIMRDPLRIASNLNFKFKIAIERRI